MKDILDKTETEKFLKSVISDKNIELEYVYGNKEYEFKLKKMNDKEKYKYENENIVILNKDIFIKCLEYCKTNYAFGANITDLDISLNDKDVRATINGLYHIKTYCKNDKLEECDPKFMIKKRIENHINDEYNYRLNLKSEIDKNVESPEVQDFLENYKEKTKTYRYKRRYSFITDDMLYRIDLTGVKMSNGKTFKSSKLLESKENYEIEIEYIGNMMCNHISNIKSFKNQDNSHLIKNNTYMDNRSFSTRTSENKIEPLDSSINFKDLYKDIETKDLYDSFNNIVYDINKIIYETEYILSMTDKNKILDGYYKLCKKKKKFMGPDLITLNRNSINSDKRGNIFKNYLVTEKADGERYLLYVTDDKHGYLINKKLVVKDSGKVFPKSNGEWLLDGEYITSDKDKNKINIYMIFDVYYATEETLIPVHMYPFYNVKNIEHCRNDVLDGFKYLVDNSKDINPDILPCSIYFKEYVSGNIRLNSDISKSSKILRESKKILLRGGYKQKGDKWEYNKKYNEYLYKIDGLIYLPRDLSVGGDYYGNKPSDISGRWDYNYKWKPPEENTIDFQVEINKEKNGNRWDEKIKIYTKTENSNTIDYSYKTCKLLVGYSLHKDDINFKDIDYCMKIYDKVKEKREPREYIKFVGKKDPWGDPCTDKGITNITLDEGRMLTEEGELIANGDIVEFRYNAEGENCSIWEPMRLRRDKTKPQDFKVAADVWQTIIDPITTEMIMGNTKSIHEYVNVPVLENKEDYYIGQSKNLKPLRDLHNYIKYKLIVGVGSKSSRNNHILDTSIGLGGDLNKYLDKIVHCKFILGLDIAPVDEACRRYYTNDWKDDKNKAVFLKYDTSKNIKDKSGLDLDLHGDNMLNIIYDIKDTTILEKYKNIDKIYRGLANKKFDIISTQFSIHYYFKDENTLNGYLENIIQNIKEGGYFIGTCYDGNRIFERLKNPKPFIYEKNGDLVYSVEKKYNIDNFDYNSDDISNMFGQKITVYMESIGQKIDEYLVNFEYLTEIMKKYGFTAELPNGMNDQFKKVITSPIGSFKNTILDLDKLKSDNKFKNTSALDILKDEKLMEISSMNNYFVFKKK